jgi:2-methylcitrate dehydratase PrpD
MPEEATQALAQFAAALTYDQLPDRIKDYCKNLLLDALACALAGHRGEETEQVAALASARNRAKAV